MTSRQPADRGSMIGTTIGGRYTLRSVLGEGGMATLYRGWDTQLEREVAVKVLRPQYGSDPEFVTRFRHEARSAGSLSHPNIVSVHDYGSEDGAQFIVMELVDGRDLAAVIREHAPLSVDDAVEIATQAAAGIEAAHRRGIVHRDVKPANILLTHDGHVRVVDFGIARAVADAGLTTTGTTLGSVHYFSPEQARGEEVTSASDVYALGIVLYEMLTGRRPFEADSAAAIALKRLSHDPPPPTTYNASLPPGLVEVVMRALERDPARRYPSAGVLRHALDTWRREEMGQFAAAPVPMPPSPVRPEPLEPVAEATERVDDDDVSAAPSDVTATGVVRAGGGVVAPTVLQAPENVPADVVPPRAAALDPDPPRRRAAEWAWAAILLLALAGISAVGFLGDGLLARTEPTTSPQRTTAGAVAAEQTVPVPELLGLTEEAARDAVADAGLRVGRVSHAASDEPADTVIATAPEEGHPVPPGSEVNLTLSRGPSPSPSPSPSPEPTPPPAPTAEATPVPDVQPPPPQPTPEPQAQPAPALGPAETVAHWYDLVQRHEFDAAYALWSDRMKANYPRQENLDQRWDDTRQVVIHNLEVIYVDESAGVASVYIDFTETKYSGREYRFIGSWDLVLGPNGWLLDQPHF